MFFLYSKSCEYAIRALTAVDLNAECFQVNAICRKAGVPPHYARKAIEQLAEAGILEAVRGRGGGYRFLTAPSKISVLRLVAAIDGAEAFGRCVMGLLHCGDSRPCPLHATWQGVKGKYLEDLENKTLSDLIWFSQLNRAQQVRINAKAKKSEALRKK